MVFTVDDISVIYVIAYRSAGGLKNVKLPSDSHAIDIKLARPSTNIWPFLRQLIYRAVGFELTTLGLSLGRKPKLSNEQSPPRHNSWVNTLFQLPFTTRRTTRKTYFSPGTRGVFLTWSRFAIFSMHLLHGKRMSSGCNLMPLSISRSSGYDPSRFIVCPPDDPRPLLDIFLYSYVGVGASNGKVFFCVFAGFDKSAKLSIIISHPFCQLFVFLCCSLKLLH